MVPVMVQGLRPRDLHFRPRRATYVCACRSPSTCAYPPRNNANASLSPPSGTWPNATALFTSFLSAPSTPTMASRALCRFPPVLPAPASSPTLACTASINSSSIAWIGSAAIRASPCKPSPNWNNAACASKALRRTSIPPPPAAALCLRCCQALPPTSARSSASVPWPARNAWPRAAAGWAAGCLLVIARRAAKGNPG